MLATAGKLFFFYLAPNMTNSLQLPTRAWSSGRFSRRRPEPALLLPDLQERPTWSSKWPSVKSNNIKALWSARASKRATVKYKNFHTGISGWIYSVVLGSSLFLSQCPWPKVLHLVRLCLMMVTDEWDRLGERDLWQDSWDMVLRNNNRIIV